jgi:ubiquinone/menaquinone biosynthesis C-methylase UbiE
MPVEPTDAVVRLPDAYRRWRTSRLGKITDRLEEALILEIVGPPAGLRVLDAALGVTLAQRGALVTGVDVDSSMLSAGRAWAATSVVAPDLMQGNVRALPFADDSFDIVLAVTVLCFADGAAQAVREMARVLRPGGRVLIGELGRWNLWAAKSRMSGWLGSACGGRQRFARCER